ncbi:MAG: Tfp pilus assembly protein PilF [Limisphaerales bacterium]|jgi:Tfp pilus assembly protein PilF
MNAMLLLLVLAGSMPVTELPPGEVTAEPCYASVVRLPFDASACLSALEQVTDDTPKARISSALAVGYAKSGNLSLGDDEIGRALQLSGEDWHTLANAGVVDLYSLRFREAHSHFTQAIQLNRDYPLHLLLNRSLAARGLGQFEEAEADVAQYRRLYSQETCDSAEARCKPAPTVGPHPGR